MDWETVCKHKFLGGLGIVDLAVKNRGLLNKWIWRYANEEDAMWRKIIVGKYGENYTNLLPENRNVRRFSIVWRNIVKPLVVVDESHSYLMDGLGYSLGNGVRISFWCHEWIDGVMLKFGFPRIFALANNKTGVVAEFGSFVNAME